MADASQNKPKKEFAYAIVGTVMFLAIVLLIGISAFLRPAANDVTSKQATEEVAAEEEVAVAEEKTQQPTPGNVEGNEPSDAQPAKGESPDSVPEEVEEAANTPEGSDSAESEANDEAEATATAEETAETEAVAQ